MLVRYHDGEYKIYGVVDEYGSVNEYAYTESYYKAPAAAEIPCAPGPDYTPGYDAAAPVVGDVKLEIDVDSVLANARTMTVESLLEGFNYGI